MKPTTVLGVALALAVFGVPVATQSQAQSPVLPAPVYASPESAGIDPQRLKRLTDYIERAIEKKELPGAVLLVARHGKIVLHEGYGRLDPAQPDPMPKDAIFRIFSMTKPLTAIAALQFAERGAVQLSDPLDMYLPAFRDMNVLDVRHVERVSPARLTRPAGTGILLFDLLRHTAGFADENYYPGYAGRQFRDAGIGSPDLTLAQAVDKVPPIPLIADPGTVFSYSETSFTVLGRVLETVADKPIAEIMAGDVFRPLGMTDTGFQIPAEKGGRVAQGFPVAGPKATLTYFDPTKPRRYHSTANGLVSTALDYWRFAQMLLDRGRSASGEALLAPATIGTMLSNSLTDIGAGPAYFFDSFVIGFTYGLGIGVKRPGMAAPMLAGPRVFSWGGANGTIFYGDLDRGLVGIVMTQKPGFAVVGRSVVGTLIMQSAID